MHKTDRIRVIGENDAIVALVRDIISQVWLKGIQEEKSVHHSYEFKLKGNPWSDSGEESVDARRLVNTMFHVFRKNGWNYLLLLNYQNQAQVKVPCFSAILQLNLQT